MGWVQRCVPCVMTKSTRSLSRLDWCLQRTTECAVALSCEATAVSCATSAAAEVGGGAEEVKNGDGGKAADEALEVAIADCDCERAESIRDERPNERDGVRREEDDVDADDTADGGSRHQERRTVIEGEEWERRGKEDGARARNEASCQLSMGEDGDGRHSGSGRHRNDGGGMRRESTHTAGKGGRREGGGGEHRWSGRRVSGGDALVGHHHHRTQRRITHLAELSRRTQSTGAVAAQRGGHSRPAMSDDNNQ